MSPDDTRSEREIFLAALEVEGDERDELIRTSTRGNPEMEMRIRRLLLAHRRAQDSESHITPPVLDDDIPESIGPYRILERVGRGGMGEVFLAEQTRPVRRRVALKVIKAGMDTKEVIARFHSERQALALMSHPNIARILDSGSTERGRPFFVMEYVPGIPLPKYCDKHELSVERRLELFIDICLAVQHAHQKGVIHRDLKPNNVLVMEQDGVPVPKVIDFGIAKAMDRKLSDLTVHTEVGRFIGTPEYMSPEQAEMTALDIDTRTDVYSLGAMLYELLVGTQPLNLTDPALGFSDIQRAISEKDPQQPSARVHAGGDEVAAWASRRGTDVSGLSRRLRDDLDWIVMKALDKDRTRRYSTSSELAADIRRHLAQEPVTAGPPSATYRLTKFVRRHRLLLGVGALGVLALLAGIVGTSIGLMRARTEAERARVQAAIAQEVNAFLNDDLLAAVAPEEQGIAVTMRQVLEVAARRVDGRFRNEPLVEASIRLTVGDTYRSLGEVQTAEPHVQRAFELRRELLGPEDPETLEAQHSLGVIQRELGHYDRAEPLLAENLEVRRRVLGEEDRETLRSLDSVAGLYQAQSRHDEAEPLFLQALETRKRLLGDDHEDTLTSKGHLAGLYRAQGHYDKAEKLYREVLETRRRVLGPDHPDTLSSMHNLSVLLWNKGSFEESETLLLETIEARKRVLGEEHPATLAAYNSLAILYQDRGRYPEAEALHVANLAARRRVSGEDHPETLRIMNNLAILYKDQKRYDEAEPLLLEALGTRKVLLGTDHQKTLLTMSALALLYAEQQRYDDAEPLYLETIETQKRVLGADHPQTGISMHNLARMYRNSGNLEESQSLFEQTNEVWVDKLGPEHPYVAQNLNEWAETLRRLGREAEAKALDERAAKIREDR